LESDDEPEDGDLLVDSNTGLTYIYKAPVEDDHLNERLIPVENAVTSFKQAVEISEFIRGVLHSHRKDATVTVADPSAVSSATFFLHGADSLTGTTSPDDDNKDTFQWSLPGSAYKTKVDLPRLGDIDEVNVWQSRLTQATMSS
jgi:hypothetical protein